MAQTGKSESGKPRPAVDMFADAAVSFRIEISGFLSEQPASFLRQSSWLRSHLAGISHQVISVKVLFPKTTL